MASEGALYLFITVEVDFLEVFLKYQIRQQSPKNIPKDNKWDL